MSPVHIQKILCTVDFSEQSRSAVEVSLALARQFDADVWVLHVEETNTRLGRVVPPWSTAVLDDPNRERLISQLRLFVRCAGTNGMRASVAVRHGEPVREIVRYARFVEPDLVVFGAPRPETQSSVANHVTRILSTPVLFVPAGAGVSVWEPPPQDAFCGT